MFKIDPIQILIAVLAFVRIGGIIFALPIFGDEPVPVRVRVLLAIALTFGLYWTILPQWNTSYFTTATDLLMFSGMVIRELFIGLCIGFIARLAFEGVLMASGLVGYQMGFGTSNLFLPGSEEKHNGFTAFNHALVVLIFLALNFHHLFVQTIFDTFRLIPLGKGFPNASYMQLIIHLSSAALVSALQLAAPIVISILFATLALGLIARTVPQVNVFVISFPVGFYVGLLVFVATLPFMPAWITGHFAHMNQAIFEAMKLLTR